MLPEPRYQNNIANGISFFSEGLKLIRHPKLRLYIIVPLLVNCALFVVLTGAFVHYIGDFSNWAINALPSFLAPLAWIAVAVISILALIVYGYSFNMITNIIAAPFYGMLAAKTEEVLTGRAPPEEAVFAMILRTLGRELNKLGYFLSRGLVVLLITILVATIPILNFVAPAIGLAWSAWSMTIQYADYAADNNQLGFRSIRNCLWRRKYSSLGFGGIIMVCSVIPIINIFAMPIAVIGGTSFWLRELKSCQEGFCPIEQRVIR